MNRLLSLLLASLTISGVFAQTEVRKYTPGVTTDGIVYCLPQTELMVAITATRTTQHAGEFHAYAQRFLRLNDVTASDKTQWKIDKVQMVNYCKPDTSKTYMITLAKGTSAPLCSITEDGILLSINATGRKPEIGTVSNIASSSTTKLNGKDYLNQEILSSGSEMKMAELTAAKIYEIRESREELIKGEAENTPKDGEQLKLMLSKLNEQEQALLQLFKGYTDTETKTFFFNYIPTSKTREIIARLSDQTGVVASDDLSGAPIYINVTDLKTVAKGETIVLDKKAIDHAVRYNIPGQAKIEMTFGNTSLGSIQIPVAQYGHVEYLTEDLFNKRATCHIWFNGLTGNIEQILDDNIKK